MAYNNFLIKLGGSTGTALSLEYIQYETYKVTPNQRMDIEAGRDSTGLLHRSVVAHTATKVEFETPYMDSNKVDAMMTLIKNYWTSTKERKINLQYYDPETNSYKTGTFYMPDIEFNIRNIDTVKKVVNYDPIRIAFIEY